MSYLRRLRAFQKTTCFLRGAVPRTLSPPALRYLSGTSSSENADVVVIGGGVVGASTAYHLAKRGVRTILLERDKLVTPKRYVSTSVDYFVSYNF